MPILSDTLFITLRFTLLGQLCETIQAYTPGGAAFVTANADGVGEAWWNDVKAAWRALAPPDDPNATFESVLVAEPGLTGAMGEYAIPTGERYGTRALGAGYDLLPSYCAVGVRLTVPTRATRPGQKRFPFLLESDVSLNVVGGAFLDLVEAVVAKYDSVITLGAPVALGTLTPKIIHDSTPTKPTPSFQDVTGHVTNPYVTTQVSRRHGHGS